MKLADLPPLPFDNSFTRELPGDPEADNHRRQVYGAGYSHVRPTPVSNPALIAWSPEVAGVLGLPEDQAEAEVLAGVFAGNDLLPGMEPWAACYGGHQFGGWAQQLGDGRAISLGELSTEGGRWELQLKGAGPTPYSRRGDGRAVLRSSIREFLCSEAMHHLGVPTTRALSLVTTGDEVIRDMFYNGNRRPEPGAIVCRVAPSFLRFGNYELPAARGDKDLLRALADYAITHHFPELVPPGEDTKLGPEVYAEWFAEVCRRSAIMVAEWMRVGFVHGVMNTDNMSILGLTIDYGPYGWIDDYDANWTPNTTDAVNRRYRFGAQPKVTMWNLAKFASALYSLVGDAQLLEAGLEEFALAFDKRTMGNFANKLGLAPFDANASPEDPSSGPGLANGALRVMQTTPTDMTIFWRALSEVPLGDPGASDDALLAPLESAYYEPERPPETRTQTLEWLRSLGERVRAEGRDPDERRAQMHAANPKYVLRNYMAQEAIELAEAGDPSRVLELLDVMRKPYDEQPGRERFAARRPDWAMNKPGCSMLSCSS